MRCMDNVQVGVVLFCVGCVIGFYHFVLWSYQSRSKLVNADNAHVLHEQQKQQQDDTERAFMVLSGVTSFYPVDAEHVFTIKAAEVSCDAKSRVIRWVQFEGLLQKDSVSTGDAGLVFTLSAPEACFMRDQQSMLCCGGVLSTIDFN